jgi:hypothetical protein
LRNVSIGLSGPITARAVAASTGGHTRSCAPGSSVVLSRGRPGPTAPVWVGRSSHQAAPSARTMAATDRTARAVGRMGVSCLMRGGDATACAARRRAPEGGSGGVDQDGDAARAASPSWTVPSQNDAGRAPVGIPRCGNAGPRPTDSHLLAGPDADLVARSRDV